jgi:hypothetical protein
MRTTTALIPAGARCACEPDDRQVGAAMGLAFVPRPVTASIVCVNQPGVWQTMVIDAPLW